MDGTGAQDRDAGCASEVSCVGFEAMHAIRADWDALAAAMRYPTVFCTWDWVSAWWQHFGAGRDLRLLLVRRDGRLIGILPLFAERRVVRADGRFGRVLSYCSASDLYPDPLDIVSAPSDAPECAKLALAHLWATRGDWDVLHLTFLSGDSELLRGVCALRFGNARTATVSGAPYIPLSGTYDSYLRGLSGNERSKISRSRRKLIEQEGAEYVDLGSQSTEQVLRALASLHEKRAGKKGITSTFARPNVLAFHLDLLGRLHQSHVWLRGIRIRGDLIAAFYGFALGGRLSYYQLGHDPDWAAYSPGAVLLQETIREAFERKFAEYNFLQGEEGFKLRWTPHVRPLHAVDVFSRSPFGQLSRLAINARRRLKSAAAALRQRRVGRDLAHPPKARGDK